MIRRLHFLAVSSLLGLLVWGGIGAIGAGSPNWNPLDDAPESLAALVAASPLLPTPRAFPEERAECFPCKLLSRPLHPTSSLASALGFPVESGSELLTFLHLSKT